MSDEVVYHHAPKVDEVNETTTTTVEQSDRGWFDFMTKKKVEENKCEEAVISSEFDQKVQVSEPEPELEPKAEEKHFDQKVQVSEFEPEPELEPKAEEKHETLFQKMNQSHSGSSSGSSSDEECETGEKKKKKKKNKSLTTQINEKIEERKEKKEEEKMEKHEDDTCVPIEKYEEVAAPPHITEVVHPIPTPEPEEKKGFVEKIKEKLPGSHKKAEEEHVAPPPVVAHDDEGDHKEKKGLMEKHPIPTPEPEEKKGFMEKIKEKLPGSHKKAEEVHVAPPPTVVAHDDEGDHKEKKGLMEKIKEKIPGYHSKSEEEKEKVKECD